jgi:competence protein ComEA
MNRLIKEYFSFSKGEIRVSIILAFVLVMVVVINIFGLKNLSSTSDFLSEQEKTELDSLIKIIEFSQTESVEIHAELKDKKNMESEMVSLFPINFDPNIVEKKILRQMGFPSTIIDHIIRYREAGGRFYVANDFRKIYGLGNDMFNQVEAYIQIGNDTIANSLIFENESIDSSVFSDTIEINTADKTDLIFLKGVGEVLAGRIIKYRNLLGGFVSEKQLLEVYGINDTIIQNNLTRIKIDTTKIRKLSLNSSEFKEFLKHPYIEMNDVKAVFELRDYYKGELNKIILEKTNILNDSTFRKISPYLKK